MQQTLLALGALAIVMLFSMQQQRTRIGTQQNAVSQQMQIIALEEATQILDQVGLLRFDQHVPVNELLELTATSDFGGGTWETATAVEQLHGVADTVVTPDGIPIIFNLTVDYVKPDTDGSTKVVTTPTYHKKVTAKLKVKPGQRPVKAELSRVYTYMK